MWSDDEASLVAAPSRVGTYTYRCRPHKSGTTGCWPTALAGSTSPQHGSSSRRLSMPRPSPRARPQPTTNRSPLEPPSPAATAADRCWSCGCWRQRLRSARHHGSHRDELPARSVPSAVQRPMRGLACPSAMPRSRVRHPSAFSMPRTSTSAFERVALTADILDDRDRRHRRAPIAIASLPSTTTAVRAAVSSLEACPTPASGRRTSTPAARSGRCPTTLVSSFLRSLNSLWSLL